MTTLRETAYPYLVPEPTLRDLRDRFTPTDDELLWAKQRARTPLKRIGLVILMKCVQVLGYFPVLRDVPAPYRDHITDKAGFARALTGDELKQVEAAGTRQANINLLRNKLGVRPVDDASWLDARGEQAALTQHQISDIINVMLEELLHHRYELPGFTVLDKVAKRARDTVDGRHFDSIADQLSDGDRRKIDGLFKTGSNAATSAWNALKQEPARPTNPAVREYLGHIRELQQLAAGLPTPDIPVAKIRYYRTLARAQNAAEMAEFRPNKRHALAVIFIRSAQAKALDDAADLFIRLYDRLENQAQRKLREYQVDRAQIIDELIERFHDALIAYQVDGEVERRMQAIEASIGDDAKRLKTLCEEHLAFSNRNYLPFMLPAYPSLRSLLFNCLDIINPSSTSQVRTVESMIQVLRVLRPSRLEMVTLSSLGLDARSDLAWMSAAWRKLVFGGPNDRIPPGVVHRKSLELAILQLIRNELRNGDLYIAKGEKYDDYREQLVDRETFAKEVVDYGEVTGIEVVAKTFVDELRTQLVEKAKAVDAAFKDNAQATIIDGRLSLRRLEKTVEPPEAEKLDLKIRERLEPVSILDALIDVERWLDLHKLFKPIAGTDTRLTDVRSRFVTTLFCFGCNLGATQTSRSVKGINRRQIGWLNLKYVTEEALDKAIVQVTNAYAK